MNKPFKVLTFRDTDKKGDPPSINNSEFGSTQEIRAHYSTLGYKVPWINENCAIVIKHNDIDDKTNLHIYFRVRAGGVFADPGKA